MTTLSEILRRVNLNRDCIWLTDSDIDLLKPGGVTGELLDGLATHGFLNFIDKPTRIDTTAATAIDHVFMRERNMEMMNTEVLDSFGISDHSMVKQDGCTRIVLR